MRRLTCAAFPVVHGDVADAGVIRDVLGGPAEAKDGARGEEERQREPGREPDAVQLLPLLDGEH